LETTTIITVLRLLKLQPKICDESFLTRKEEICHAMINLTYYSILKYTPLNRNLIIQSSCSYCCDMKESTPLNSIILVLKVRQNQ